MPLDPTANRLRYLILAIQAEGERRLNAALQEADTGLTATQAEVLELLDANGPMSQGELGAQLVCTKGNVSRLLDRMQAKGLLRRDPDPQTRRRVRIRLTEGGRQAFHAAEAPIATILDMLQDLYDEEEMRQLIELLSRLSDALGVEYADRVGAEAEEARGV